MAWRSVALLLAIAIVAVIFSGAIRSSLSIPDLYLGWIILVYMILLFSCYGIGVVSDWRRGRLDVSPKDVLAYRLFKASEFLERYDVEQGAERKNILLNRSLKHLEGFGRLLKSILKRSTMPFDLPDIRQLRKLYENIMNRLYPAIRERHEGADILLTLSSVFSLEREYNQLPEINESLENSLDPKTFEEKEGFFTSLFISPMKRSFAVASFTSLMIVTIGAFLAVCLFRVPVKGWMIDWAYIADNAATIVVGILASWAAILVILGHKYKQE